MYLNTSFHFQFGGSFCNRTLKICISLCEKSLPALQKYAAEQGKLCNEH